MEDKFEDRRVRKTKTQLQQTLAKLLVQKPINKITVKELCDMVDINRSTFYAHYQDVYELMEQIQNYICESFQDIVNRYPMSDQYMDLQPMETEMFEFLLKEEALAQVILCHHGNISFLQEIHKIIMAYFEEHWHKFLPQDTTGKWVYSFHFVVSGCLGLMQQWLESDRKETPKEMAAMMSKLISNGIYGLGQSIQMNTPVSKVAG